MTDEKTKNELIADIANLRREVATLTSVVGRMADLDTTSNVLMHGLEEVAEQLSPLRDLTPRRTLPKDAVFVSLQRLQDAMKRPSWGGGGLLAIEEKRVPFIGEVPPDSQPDESAQATFTSNPSYGQASPATVDRKSTKGGAAS